MATEGQTVETKQEPRPENAPAPTAATTESVTTHVAEPTPGAAGPSDAQQSPAAEPKHEHHHRRELSLPILLTIKTAQLQHGLRHEDYMRYRQYCTRRLHRLRKALSFRCGKAHFIKKKLEPRNVKNAKYLLIPLLNAERAWSYAMELKQDRDNPRAKFHTHKRLKKAVFWAGELLALCKEVGNDRTKLEAEAYFSWLNATLLLEDEDWEKARENFALSRTIYDQLGKYGQSEMQEMCRDVVAKIDPIIRFCNYSLGNTESENLMDLVSDERGGDVLQSQLDKVLAELRKEHAESMREVNWKGRVIPVKSGKIREHIIAAQEHLFEKEKAQGYERKSSLHDKAYLSYSEALNAIRDELRSLESTDKRTLKQDTQMGNLRVLREYVEFSRLNSLMQRNILLVESLIGSMKAKGDHTVQAKPKEIIKVYDSLLQNLKDMKDVKGEDDEDFVREMAAKYLYFKAFRCYYVAFSFLRSSKWPEALALFQRTRDYAVSATEHYRQCQQQFPDDLEALKKLITNVDGKVYAAQAKSFLNTLREEDATAASNDVGSSQGSLLSDLNAYEEGGRVAETGRLIDFPPNFKAVPCKPILFDLAGSSIEFPNLDHRKKKKGFFGFW